MNPELIDNREPTWTSFYGGRIVMSKLSHQHLSNILHYFKIFYNSEPSPLVRQQLETRFGGIQLPYHPLISFTYEIRHLVSKGYTNGEPNSDITIDGKWIGTVKYD